MSKQQVCGTCSTRIYQGADGCWVHVEASRIPYNHNAIPADPPAAPPCRECEGSGTVSIPRTHSIGQRTCPTCKGSGKAVPRVEDGGQEEWTDHNVEAYALAVTAAKDAEIARLREENERLMKLDIVLPPHVMRQQVQVLRDHQAAEKFLADSRGQQLQQSQERVAVLEYANKELGGQADRAEERSASNVLAAAEWMSRAEVAEQRVEALEVSLKEYNLALTVLARLAAAPGKKP